MSTAERLQGAQTSLAAVIAVVIVAKGAGPALQIPAAISLTLFLPGFSVLRAAKMTGRGNLQAGSLAVGLSMAITALGGLVLNLLGAFSPTGWALLLGGIVILASAAPLLRPADPIAALSPAAAAIVRRPLHLAMYAAAAICLLASYGMARSGAVDHHEYKFTEFWMVPKGAATNIVTIGIRNAEQRPSTYQVALLADGAAIGRGPEITLAVGESWSGDFPLNAQLARAGRVQAWLFKSDAPQDVYRKVWLARPASTALTTKDQQ